MASSRTSRTSSANPTFRCQRRFSTVVRKLRPEADRKGLALEVSRMAAWEWNLASGQLTWSSDPEALFGFPPGAFGVEKRLFVALHPDDKHRTEQALVIAVRSGAYEGDYRIVRPDRSMVWITEPTPEIAIDRMIREQQGA